MALTVKEKEQWVVMMRARIEQRIELLWACAPGAKEKIQEQAKWDAYVSLGCAELKADVEALSKESAAVKNKLEKAELALLSKILGREVEDASYSDRSQRDGILAARTKAISA